MANVATNVSTGKPNISGAVYVAPSGTAVPTDATTALASDFVCLGYISEDGISNSNDMDMSNIKAWGGVTVYRSLNGIDDTFAFTMIESLNSNVLKAVYGDDNVTVDSNKNTIAIDVNADDPQEKVWVFEFALRGGKKKRTVVPDGAITSRDEITYNDSDAIGYGVTLSAYADSNLSTHKEYIA